MKEKTFEELIEEKENMNVPNFIHFNDVHELMQHVREETNEEWCQAFLGVTLPAETVKKIGKIVTTTDRIIP